MHKNILIAGGTGLIGKKLTDHLRSKGHKVHVLTRKPSLINEFKWDPVSEVLDYPYLSDVEILINLSGAGIGDARWTEKRKKELIKSRVGTNEFLFSFVEQMKSLEHFISSSGINAYGWQPIARGFREDDPFGSDFVSHLVKEWEESADHFNAKCIVTKLRTAVVLAPKGGAIEKMLPAVKLGIASPLGKGSQIISWIHINDLIRVVEHVIDHRIDGPVNSLAGNCSNSELMHSLAITLKKPFFFPKVPAFVLRTVFGEMADLLLKGVACDNSKLLESGYQFQFNELNSALSDICK